MTDKLDIFSDADMLSLYISTIKGLYITADKRPPRTKTPADIVMYSRLNLRNAAISQEIKLTPKRSLFSYNYDN